MTAKKDDHNRPGAAAPQKAPGSPLEQGFAEEALRKQSEWLAITLASIGDGVISTDAAGCVTFMNKVAEGLTGWSHEEALARPLPEIFEIVNEQTLQPVDNPALRALKEGTIVGLANHTILISRDGTRRPIDDSAAPMRDERQQPVGAVLVFRDVTERKQAEEDRARLAAIVDSSEDAIISKTLDGVIRSWNTGAARVFGYTAKEAIGQPITLIIPPERFDEERGILEKLRRGERVEWFETIRVAKDGRRLDISLTISPIRDHDGRVIGTSKIARDITERKRAEDALRESRARLDYAVRLSGVGFWYCDLPFFELNWDARVHEHFWFPADARVTIEMFYGRLHPDDREPTRQAIETSIRERKPYDVDYRTVDPESGAIKWLRALGGAAYAADGSPVRFDGVTLDVTDRKLDEIRLAHALQREREQGRMLRLLPEAAQTIHSSGSLDSVLRVIAEEARRILRTQYAASSLTHGDDFAQSITSVAATQKLEPGLAEAFASVGAACSPEVCQTNRPLRLTGAELGERPGLHQSVQGGDRSPPLRGWLAAPFVNRRGKNLGLIQVANKAEGDFTEIDEAALVQLAHIASVAIENARLYGELREQDRRKDEFLALLAHELRNPLAPLRNGLQVMRLAEHDPEALTQAREMMERQLGHMVRLVDDLLDVSRISRNKMELRRSRVLLADVVSGAVETSRPAIEAAGHELTITLPAQPVYLDADLTRLAQVFGNLLSNSAKYTERGGRIWLTASRQGDQVSVLIQDTGIGIPAYALPNIFDMFSQVDRSIERSTGGLGIGLALVKGLVEMHGGTVEASSPGQGKGSTFIVKLPVFEDPVEKAATTPSGDDARAAGPRRRILVVDDNQDSAVSMAMMLKLLGNDVRSAHDGLEAIAAAEAFRPQVILMDVGMPRLNGYDATRRIRELPWGQSTIIIALTGWGQEVDRAQSKEVGCDAHLVKPVHLPDLERLLAELTAKRDKSRV